MYIYHYVVYTLKSMYYRKLKLCLIVISQYGKEKHILHQNYYCNIDH